MSKTHKQTRDDAIAKIESAVASLLPVTHSSNITVKELSKITGLAKANLHYYFPDDGRDGMIKAGMAHLKTNNPVGHARAQVRENLDERSILKESENE